MTLRYGSCFIIGDQQFKSTVAVNPIEFFLPRESNKESQIRHESVIVKLQELSSLQRACSTVENSRNKDNIIFSK